MTADTVLNLVMQYGPTILTVAMLVLTTLSQKSNLFSGLKTLKEKAEELKVAAEFKDVQDKMQSLIITIKEQEKIIQDLTNAVYKIRSDKEE